MSFDPTLWAMKDAPVMDVEEWAVLVCMAEHADDDGCTSMPSQTTIAARTKTSLPTVKRRMAALEARGIITRGDQSAALIYKADRRPVVYDLMIPFSWFPSIERIQQYRATKGRAPLLPSDRPDLGPAPEKKRRADLGVVRNGGSTGATGLEDPRVSGSGGSPGSERGVSVLTTGVQEDLQPSQGTFPIDPPPAAPTSGAGEAKAKGRRQTKNQRTIPADLEPFIDQSRDIVSRYMDWWKVEKGGPILKAKEMYFSLVESFVAPALRDGFPERVIVDCLAACAKSGNEWPSDPVWRRNLNIVSGVPQSQSRPPEPPRVGSGVWDRVVNPSTDREKESA